MISKLSTMKRYVEAMGGKLRVDVELPTGRHIGFNVDAVATTR